MSKARILPDVSAQAAARIAELEAQVAALASGVKQERTYVGAHKKDPNVNMLHFEGNFFPFSFSREKCTRIVKHIDAIKRFSATGK